MRLFKRYRELSEAERGLFFTALLLMTGLRIALLTLPFRVVRRLVDHLRQPAVSRNDLDSGTIPQIVWAVQAASRRIPGASCLPQSMATQVLLGRRGQS